MKRPIAAAAAVFAIAISASAGTGDPPLAPPDPATITMPPLPLAFTAKDVKAGNDRFYFHKEGVTYENAYREALLCIYQSVTANFVPKPPDFVPIGKTPPTSEKYLDSRLEAQITLGTIGGVVGAWLEDQAITGRLRVCMRYRGYKRYALSRAAYQDLIRDGDSTHVARIALAASGPTPLGGELEP